jgi:small subunit ribosomal protein S16
MLMIRLSRVGKKGYPTYRLVISEKQRDPYGKALEILGSYNPHSKDLQAKADRIVHWISMGAQMSDTVNNLLVSKKIIEGKKTKSPAAKTKRKEAKK